MQIKRLKIDNHLCLVDFEIDFQTVNGGSSTILIGENGTGKTTLIETVLMILMSFDSPKIEKEVTFDYCMEYEYAQETYRIRKTNHYYQIETAESLFKGSYAAAKEFLECNSFFPQRIIVFYSGANNKIKKQISRVNGYYASKCRQNIQSYYSNKSDHYPWFEKRKYNYCREELIPVYLAAIIGGYASFEKEYLSKQCSMSDIAKIQVSLSVPFAARIIGQRNNVQDANEAICEIVDYIDKRMTATFRMGFISATTKQAFYELNEVDFQDMDSVAIYNFFEKLQTLLNGQFETHVNISGKPIKSSDLSEGQRQLIKMLGMLGVCKSEDTLALLDEPDAHMNPRWKYEIKSVIDKCLIESINTQAIIATHDPLVINGVDKEYIRIFELNKECHSKAIEPTEDTKGLGIDGLLQSEYYGLKTSYDKQTSDIFIRRQELYSKLINDEIEENEKEELRELTKEIGLLPVSYNSIDFLYDDFIRVFKESELFSKEYLSYDEVLKRRDKIKEIITALYEGNV